ncbi:choline/ethanolamine transporter FLVCR2-like [Neodiprion pinetum]|uniref:choline/ethanolamine transporter FLVCR2-like n=1 Tax=Neodiprion pinetum TaxID=441929 RepID=UPI001EDE46CF|nr:feline leukemia virus subgroup C receptor-related protein 2-like [Neodiprion pinetum]
MCIVPVPARLAACWFGKTQVAFACSIAVFSLHLGIALGIFMIPFVVRNHENLADIGNDLSNLYWGFAVYAAIAAISVFVFFQDEPPLPPSDARALRNAKRLNGAEEFWPTIKRILTNKSFILLWNSYGLICGVSTTFGALINPLYVSHFKTGETDTGLLSLISTILGTLWTLAAAAVLDRTKKFRLVATAVYAFALIADALFATSLIMEIRWMAFVMGIFFGIQVIGYPTIGLELCMETTYPESEGITAGILNMAPQFYGTLSILIVGRVLEAYGHKVAHACMCGELTVGLLLTVFNKLQLYRQKASKVTAVYNIDPQKALIEFK